MNGFKKVDKLPTKYPQYHSDIHMISIDKIIKCHLTLTFTFSGSVFHSSLHFPCFLFFFYKTKKGEKHWKIVHKTLRRLLTCLNIWECPLSKYNWFRIVYSCEWTNELHTIKWDAKSFRWFHNAKLRCSLKCIGCNKCLTKEKRLKYEATTTTII